MKTNNLPLTLVEIFVIGGICFAFIFPLFSASEEEDAKQLKNSIPAEFVKA